MSTETIKVGKDELQIETKPLTFICKAPGILEDIEYPERIVLDPEVTMYHIKRVQKLDPELFTYLHMVFGDLVDHLKTADDIRREGSGVQHISGLLDLTLKLSKMNAQLVWKDPESFLHPKFQANLADVLIAMTK